ncbi:MAG: TonB-dependent receptor [Odoribacteraceae bacterium]|jgi:TonB-linked SusC/RagA family outer membrane protein|nr:TonB-dependent receptor [Odoribacteraceae bacterium]
MFNTIHLYTATGYRHILLIAALLCSFSFARAQETLHGRIADKEGKPISGAVVNVAEASRIALSDANGLFSLKNVKAGDELIVTCPGYKTLSTFAAFTGELFTVEMEGDTDEYAHATPLPFGKQKRKFVTAATSVVTGAELEKHPITVLQNAFTSTVTGVETYEAQSEPGWSESALYIRGIRTMNSAARAPLIIVDNMERDLSFLDAYPIESITILKDAAAAAIYGMRGANGVVLVTTRRGAPGKTNINFTQEFGFQTLAGIPESQNSYNYALTRNQALYLDGGLPEFSDEDIQHYYEAAKGTLDPALKYKYFSTNWHDVMLRELAPQHRTNLSVSGGNNRTRYFLSFSYLHQEGLYDTRWTEWNSGYSTQHVLDRFNLRSNIDMDINRFLDVSLDLGGRIDNIVQPGIDTWNLFTWGAGENKPIFPVFCPDGSFFMPTESDSKNGAAQIAGRGIETNRRRNLYTNATATGNLDFITEGLKAKVTVGFDSYEIFQAVQRSDIDVYYYNFGADVSDPSEYEYKRMRTGIALPNPSTTPRDYYYNINAIGGLEYNRAFGRHVVEARAFLRTYKNVVRGQNSSNRYLSYNAAATYIYDNRYVLSGNLSYMGGDNFAPSERFAAFPGISAAWVLSEEPWLKSDCLRLLKLRASYGTAGQANVGAGRYPYQGTYAEGNGYNFGTSQAAMRGSYESTTGNKNIKWELSTMLNVGLDFDLLDKRFHGSVDLFKEWRSNILVTRSTIPWLYGADVPQDSYGTAETRGVELTLGHANRIGDFHYYLEGLLTWNTNKITEMDELPPNFDYQARTGNRIDQHQLLQWVQWASDPDLIPASRQDAIDNPDKYPWHAAGKYKLGNAVFKDVNKDRVIDSYDKIPDGYTNIPELLPSLKVGLGWKGFDARVILTAYLNRTVECRENMDYGFGWGGTATHAVTSTWGYYNDDPNDPRNTRAKYPRLSTMFSDIDRNYPYNESTIWFQNGDFLSVRNIEVGYSLPGSLVAKAYMTRCRLYFSGYNLFTYSHLPKGFDPENPTNYIWAYPKTKSFSIGLNISF